ncbi:MAG: hypothetical protein DCC73_01530 [Proteobacteria bacterium]|nr:MAG: hypothetical protein DCC73_01530 [Pseudomonadota bacterium]
MRTDQHLPTVGRVRSRTLAAAKALMPALGIAAGFTALSLLNLWDNAPPALHALIFIAALVVGAISVLHALRALIAPSPRRALHWAWYLTLPPLLIIGSFAAGDDWQRRLTVGFRPGLLFAPPPMEIEATATPPAYTRQPVIRLKIPSDGNVIALPVDSRIEVRASGARFAPLLAWGSESVLLRPEKPGVFAIEGEVRRDGDVRVTFAGRTLAGWRFKVVEDAPPKVALAAAPTVTARGSLRLHVEASDDYGIDYAAIRLRRVDGGEEALIDLPIYGAKQVEEIIYRDLRTHAFAGAQVTLQVVAVDGRTQEGVSEPLPFQLPQRRFKNAVAQSLAAIRETIRDGSIEDLEQATRRLAAVSESAAVHADVTVQLGVRTAYQRLRSGVDEQGRQDIINLLWDLALRAEDGALSQTETQLHDAIENLKIALKKGMEPAKTEAAMQELASAFEAYGRARSRRLGGALGDRENFDWVAVQRFLSRLADVMTAGDAVAAVAQLSDLEAGLEERGALMLSAIAYRRFLVANYARRLLDDVAREQRQLLSRSVEPASGDGAAGDQAALREVITGVIEQLDRAGVDNIESLRRAKAAMDDALRQLAAGEAKEAAMSQAQALTALDVAGKALAAVPSPLATAPDGRLHDPLGRPLPPLPGTGVDNEVGRGKP